MSVARRPLLTAATAGALLCALWFVPSANATADQDGTGNQRTTAGVTGEELRLADTGSPDTTPYLIGGTAFLGIGVGFVTYAVRQRASLVT
ncbi:MULTISPECIES: hypothetical protein [unclassified Streptomyces]|uniref:hypothetical protein n=1 Tax=unclassified Streptomyces TaxID=2593676 RepID=UPI002E2BEB0D|nr:hypothetical protein [Streptomyces sp. NBC_00690]